MARRSGYNISIRNLNETKGIRKLYHFDAYKIIVRDKTLNDATEYDIYRVKDDFGVSGMCLLSHSNLFPTDDFYCASKAFETVEKDYSTIIR